MYQKQIIHMYSLVRAVSRMGVAPRVVKYSSRLYHDLVIDHYEHPRNVGMFILFSIFIL